MAESFEGLRSKYKSFSYNGWSLNREDGRVVITFDFALDFLCEFHPTWTVPIPPEGFDESDPFIRELIFSIGMTEAVSYWKAACPQDFIVRAGYLSDAMKRWWKKLYYGGLGEFFYRNGIKTDYDSFMDIECTCEKPDDDIRAPKNLHGCLIPIGGGKDSIVTSELLHEYPAGRAAFGINPKRANLETAALAGFTGADFIAFGRTLDKNLLGLNARGFLNGHTPFSALVAFSSVLAAYLYGFKYVVLSNEGSANETTVGSVNHQYSKSAVFESDFRSYISSYIPCGVGYFSLLRPFAEIAIARHFCRFPKYFRAFLSCNLGSKTDCWCGKCPKCLFIFIMLLPFLDISEVSDIFGSNLADDPAMLTDFRKLLGLEPEKPFECVGSRSEVHLACELALRRGTDALLLREFASYGLPAADENIINSFDTTNFIPYEFLPYLAPMSPYAALISEFCGKKVAIMGFGREGLSTYRLIRAHYPDMPLLIADKNAVTLPEDDQNAVIICGDGYIDACRGYNMIVKAPGIPSYDMPDEIKAKLTCQTQLFLRHYRGQTVGVTGTKGKSTTSSLIYHVLKASGRDTMLVGNIGSPVFDSLRDISPSTTVVYELSCHQLESSPYSPAFAVLLNLYEEHLDHYKSAENYFAAKKNIFLHCRPGDFFIYNYGNPELSAEETASVTADSLSSSATDSRADIFSSDGIIRTPDGTITLDTSKIRLRGAHNFGNIGVAYAMLHRLGITDAQFADALYSFNGLAHRLQPIGTVGGVDYYDDSISTIPVTAIEGMKSLKNVGCIMLGGMERGIDYSPLIEFLKTDAPPVIVLMPDTGARLLSLIDRAKQSVTLPASSPLLTSRCCLADSLEEAVSFAKAHCPAGTCCLFSPAAASYHAFKNFEARGDEFARLVLSK